MNNPFIDRAEAGKLLAKKLKKFNRAPDVILLALPRGGVPIAKEIADILHLPMNVFLVRKLGFPHQEELAMGAIAENNVCIFNEAIIKNTDITQNQIEKVIQKEQQEMQRRVQAYRKNKDLPSIENKTVILVDDGLATGATMRAAIAGIKKLKAKKIVIAVPVAAQDTYENILSEKDVDDAVAVIVTHAFGSVGQWYENFNQVSDEEVCEILESHSA